jgi:hypothetical protein
MKKTIVLILFFTLICVLSYYVSSAFPSIVRY